MSYLNHLPNSSKIWIFQSNKQMNNSQMDFIKDELKIFLPLWNNHGNSLTNQFEIIDSFFIIVGVDENKVIASGCSKDSLTRKIQDIGNQLNLDFFNRLNIAYLNQNKEISLKSLPEFKKSIQKDDISLKTIMFNNLIETKEDLEQRWKIPVEESWLYAMVKPI